MLFGVNVNATWLHEAAVVLGCRHGQLPFLYLGLPIGGDPSKLCFWHPLVDRIRKRLSGWKCKNLSFGGRLILLKYVLSSIPVYFLSFFKAPSGKWVWRCLVENDSLWSLVLRAKYGQEGGRVRFSEGVGSTWRKVGGGRGSLFWLDPWLEDSPFSRSFSRLYDLVVDKNILVADMFEAGWGVGGEAWKWRRRLFAWEEDLVAGCIARLANVSLQVGVPDSWVWQLHNSGCYSVKTAYSYLTASEARLMKILTSFFGYDRFL
ncbi:hypothetical protein TSUD_357760 [Trifolium subterraneum]|uniref:Reverse transcriptase zinc-binding domain-containing protein n=1 Tax=Trifolium subterraneum TaxID=3900 RepID=A0A2Z6MYI9_TRISU|nr:hypothetical protein TSUD_357760 [Trifolium subterraneum]